MVLDSMFLVSLESLEDPEPEDLESLEMLKKHFISKKKETFLRRYLAGERLEGKPWQCRSEMLFQDHSRPCQLAMILARRSLAAACR